LNGTHQLLIHAHDDTSLGENISTVEKNTKALLDASKEVDPGVNVEKSKLMFMSYHHNAGQL